MASARGKFLRFFQDGAFLRSPSSYHQTAFGSNASEQKRRLILGPSAAQSHENPPPSICPSIYHFDSRYHHNHYHHNHYHHNVVTCTSDAETTGQEPRTKKKNRIFQAQSKRKKEQPVGGRFKCRIVEKDELPNAYKITLA